MTEQETRTHCFMCGHPWDSHDPNPDGTRSCRSPSHPNGVPCADCRAMLTSEYRECVQEERDGAAFEAAWNAFMVTREDARNAFGEHAPVFFTDINQSALASALIAYRKQRVQDLKADWSRYRGRVLQEAWEALRDAEDGPLIDGMNVINKLLEQK